MSEDEDVSCQFQACEAFVVTQCPDNYLGGGGTPTASGFNNKIELYRMDDPTTMLTVTGSSGPCGFPEFSYTPSDSTCHTYKVRQTCYTVDCAGRTAIYTPAPAVIDVDAGGGLCAPFNVVNGVGESWCPFTLCGGGHLFVSTCPEEYYGAGTVSCGGNTQVTLYQDGVLFSLGYGSAPCGTNCGHLLLYDMNQGAILTT